MMTENDMLMEIVHLASAALVADLTEVKRKALANIADAIAAIVPVEGRKIGAELSTGRRPLCEAKSLEWCRAETGRACRAHACAPSGFASGECSLRATLSGASATADGEERKALEKIALRLKALCKTNMLPPQVEWLDVTRQIAENALGRAVKIGGEGAAETGLESGRVGIGGEGAAETGGTRSVASAGAPQGMAAFLKISDRLQLVRFRGPDFVQLVGRIKAHDGTPNQVFEIHVDKDDRTAVVYRDEKPLWTINGTSRVRSALVEQMAVSTLHRWWKSTRRNKKIGGEGAPRIAPASQLASLGGYAETGRGNPDYKKYILSTHEELARTVAEQKNS